MDIAREAAVILAKTYNLELDSLRRDLDDLTKDVGSLGL
jgi:hypothetical protein